MCLKRFVEKIKVKGNQDKETDFETDFYQIFKLLLNFFLR